MGPFCSPACQQWTQTGTDSIGRPRASQGDVAGSPRAPGSASPGRSPRVLPPAGRADRRATWAALLRLIN